VNITITKCNRSLLLQPAQLHLQGIEKVRILIVDYEPAITLALWDISSLSGFEYVDAFNDSLLALENFKPGSHDLVILDIAMSKRFALFKNSKEIDLI